MDERRIVACFIVELWYLNIVTWLMMWFMMNRNSARRRNRQLALRNCTFVRRMVGSAYLDSIIGYDDVQCVNQIRMDRRTFHYLCQMLRDHGRVQLDGVVTMEEQVCMFLHILAHHVKNRTIGSRFCRSRETISRYFNSILHGVLRLQGRLLKVPEPIPNAYPDPKWSWFENCLGALDGTYINVHVPEQDKPKYRSSKGEIATNIVIPDIGTCFFSLAASDIVTKYEPFKNTSSDSDPFVIPDFPGEITMTRAQVPDYIKENIENDLTRLVKRAKEAEKTSYGIVVNSFYELESVYADYYRNVLGMKAWNIGPVSLCNRNNEEKALRGKAASITEHDLLKWLDSKEPNSVVYVCFGSLAKFNASQLKEIAMGLEASGQDFIWVVRTGQDSDVENEDWLPEGFEERMEGKGLIIRGWAPQVLILDHGAVGGFVTHCGWNSTLEGIAAGLPMVTWPVSAEQFYNEKLVTEVLKIGVGVGAKKWVRVVGDSVKKEAVEKAVRRIMVGEEAQEMRSRARELAEQAKRAVEKGGSSHSDLNALIEELSSQ